jgi:oligosaccharide repeat unit polymerase
MRRVGGTSTIAGLFVWTCIGGVAIWLITSLQNERASAMIACVVFALSLIYTRYNLGYGILSAPFLYLAVLGAFHLGLVGPWSLHLYDPWELWWFYRLDLQPALLLVTLAFVCCQMGLILAERWRPRPKPPLEVPSRPLMDDRRLFWAGVSLLAVGVAAYLQGTIEVFGPSLSTFVYTDMFRLVQERNSRWLGMGIVLVPMGLYSAAAAATRKQLLYIIGVLGVWVTWQLYLGSRSGALIPAIAVSYVCAKKHFKISKRITIPIFLALMYLIPLVSAVRLLTAPERLHLEYLREAQPLSGIAEMGQSIWTLAETYRLIGAGDFRYGMTYVEALKRVVPNISVSSEPGHELRTMDYENSPAYWFVLMTAPWLLKEHLGLGFSSIAEAYMNFGAIGVVIVFSLLGLVLARIEAMAIRNAYFLAGQTVILAPLLWTVRNDFTVFTRAAVWGCAFVFFVWWFGGILGRIRKRGAFGPSYQKAPTRPLLRAPAPSDK